MLDVSRNLSGPIVMLVRALSGGGAQRDAIELANGLHHAGWPVTIATLDAEGPLRALIDPAIKLLHLGQGRRLRMALAAPALLGMMRSLHPAVVIASEAAANGLLVLVAQALPVLRRPKIILREVASPLQARRSDPYWQNRLAYRLAPLFYPRADRVLSFTEGARRDLIANFAVQPDRAVNLGTNAVMTTKRLHALSRSFPRRAGLVIAIGRLSPEKDFATLLMAFAGLRKQCDARLIILGEGLERPMLERRVRALDLDGAVELPGFVADPTDYLRRASLFVSTSRHEGFGNAIVEALACGVPIVATDAPHGPREILQDGRFGTLVPLDDLPALVQAMTNALEAPTDRCDLQARAADFTTERAVARFAELLRDLGVPTPMPELPIC